ncbi:metallophosphoesterase family protein [Shimazuella sp. AN120528]|uniref:metallophosphoesterase family protein n=1 Tax=Shimazuella soli TaxID=1892854 RepID=UPI001F0EB226|nr:metallophosphoesterase [Shimazuella soli]MCH5586422.1 metallophosphoesterase family protein [Shimazuella soli]
MRLLYFTDTHIRGTSPRGRTDDFFESMKRKLNEIIQIAEKNKVDYVLHGGDVFDRPNLSPAVVREFAQLFREFSVPVYAIAGNHDIFGHNPATVDRTMLGLLEAFGVLTLVKPKEHVVLSDGTYQVQLTGQAFHYDLDKRTITEDYAVTNRIGADYCIHMVHGMLVDKALPEGVPHTMVSALLEMESDADILLTGHYHAGFPIQHKNNKYIINPGSVARLSNQQAEIRRMPQVVLIELGKEIQIQFQKLTTAARGEDVFDRSVQEESLYRQEKWAQFAQEVNAAGIYQGIQVEEIIEEIAKIDLLDPSVKAEALKRIGEAQEMAGEKNNDTF